jgi:hypothetical protein
VEITGKLNPKYPVLGPPGGATIPIYSMSNITTRKPCPFPQCPKEFSGSSNLKKHLRGIREAGGNEHHIIDDELWKDLEVFLRVFTRPGGLSEEQFATRHAQANQRWYDKNKEKVLASQKMERTEKKEAAALARDLSIELSERAKDIQQLSATLERHRATLESLWVSNLDQATNPKFDPKGWVMKHSPDGVDSAAFPRFVTFYLPTREWPKPSASVDTVCAQLPNETHFHQINLQLHRDSNACHVSREETDYLTETLNASWDIWNEYLSDPQWNQVSKFRDEEEKRIFSTQSSKHKGFANLVAEWTSAYMEGLSAITPTNISLKQLGEMYLSAKNAAVTAENVNSPVNNLIARASKIKDPRIQVKGGRKRKRDGSSDRPVQGIQSRTEVEPSVPQEIPPEGGKGSSGGKVRQSVRLQRV